MGPRLPFASSDAYSRGAKTAPPGACPAHASCLSVPQVRHLLRDVACGRAARASFTWRRSHTKADASEMLAGRSTCLSSLSQAFSAVDKEDTGFVKPSDFGQVLKDFCHKLTDNQFHCLLRKLRLHLTPCISWKYFLQSFGGFLEEVSARAPGRAGPRFCRRGNRLKARPVNRPAPRAVRAF